MSLSFLSPIDFFSIFPGFFVKRHLDYKTGTGGLITILIITATVIIAVIFSQELFLKKDPNVSTALKINEHPSTYQYPYPIFFMISLRDGNDMPTIDEKLYYIEANIFNSSLVNKSISSKKYPIKIKRCNETLDEKFQYYKLIEDIDLENYYCLDNSDNDLSIKEFWGNENFQMLQIKMYKCNFTNEANGCKNENEIDNFLSKASVQIYSIKNYLNSNDHKNPLNTGIEENFYYILEGFHTTVFHYLRELEINDDVGLIFEEKKTKKSFTIDSEKNFINQSIKNKKFFSFAIQLTNNKEIYTRTYFKLQDLGAQVSSFYSIFMVVGSIILKFYHKSEYCLDLLNEFFEIDTSNIKINKISDKLKKNKNSKILIGKSTVDEIYPQTMKEEIKIVNLKNIKGFNENTSNRSNEINNLDDIKFDIPTDNSDSDYIKNIPMNNKDINLNKHSNYIGEDPRKSYIRKLTNYTRKPDERKVNFEENNKVFTPPKIKRSLTKNSHFILDNFPGKLKNIGTLNSEKEIVFQKQNLKNGNMNEEEKIKDSSTNEKSFNIDKMIKECQENSGKIKLSIWDRLIGIEFCDQCKKKNSKFYKTYYLGQEFFLKTLEVSIFLKDMNTQSNFVKFYLTDEQYKIFRYVSQPVLNVDYVGTRYNRDNIPDDLAEKLGFQKE